MATTTKTVNVGGKAFTVSKTFTPEGELAREKILPAAKAATLTTRTDNDTGVITVAAGVGAEFTVGDRVDVYWDIGGTKGHRRGMKVSSIATDAITVGTVAGDIGAGDNFPAAASVVVLAKSVLGEFRVDGTDLSLLVLQSEARGLIVLTGDDDVEDHFLHFPSADVEIWDSTGIDANPVTGDVITRAYMSHADTAVTRRVKVGAAFN